MTEFIYVLSYDPLAKNFTHTQLQVLIERSRDISTWYFPFPGTYIIKSTLSLPTLATPFRQFFGETPYVLTHVVPSLIGGSLPPAIWEWINANQLPALRNSE